MNLKEKKNNENKNLSNGIGNRGLKELICMTHGRELSQGGGECWWEEWCRVEGKIKERNKNETTVIA